MSAIRARAILVAFALLLAATLTALVAPAPPANVAATVAAEDRADVTLYDSIVEQLRHGGNYYAVTADALRAGNYPLRPFVTFRLPTLAVLEAMVSPVVLGALLYALAAAVLFVWAKRLGPAFSRSPPRMVAVLLLAGGMARFVQLDLVVFHEIWAGLLIALSLAVRRPGRWLEAVAFGAMAMLIRETAALYVVAMAALAWAERERREALGWGASIFAFAVVVAFHAQAVALVVRPLDLVSPGWEGLHGFGFFVQATIAATALSLAPIAIAAPLVGLALFGWASWRDPLAIRVLATSCVYALLIAAAARPDTWYWALLSAAPLLVGLAFVPDALRDLFAAALDRRRITVTRVSR